MIAQEGGQSLWICLLKDYCAELAELGIPLLRRLSFDIFWFIVDLLA